MMKPVGFSSDEAFVSIVMHYAYPAEPLEVSVERLAATIREDAKALRVACEMSPARVRYAYRNHPSLAQARGVRKVFVIPHGDPRSAEQRLEDFTMSCRINEYFTEMFQRIRERNKRENDL